MEKYQEYKNGSSELSIKPYQKSNLVFVSTSIYLSLQLNTIHYRNIPLISGKQGERQT